MGSFTKIHKNVIIMSVMLLISMYFLSMINKKNSSNKFIYLNISKDLNYSDFSNLKVIKNEIRDAPDFLIDNPMCKIPQWDPADQSLDKVLKQSDPFECPKHSTDGLILESQGVLHINVTIKEKFLIERGEDPKAFFFNCCVHYILRDLIGNDRNFSVTEKCLEFANETFPLAEPMAKIDCHIDKTVVYEKYVYALLPEKLHSMDRLLKNSSSNRQSEKEEKLSVLILGIDSVSRVLFQRSMPQTAQTLGLMGAVEFLGYNRLSDNTFPCLMPLLTGSSIENVTKGCARKYQKRELDECHFLWKDFEENGYVTAYVENYNEISTFNGRKVGFKKIPTDFYGKPFFAATDKFLKGKKHCFEEVPEDEFVFRWAVEYQRRLRSVPKFGFFWINRFCHDNASHIQRIDPFLSRLLTVMAEEDLLDHTVLIVMSDHGTRYGEVMKLKVGDYQSNLPILYFVFPSWYRKRYKSKMETFKANAGHRLVTLYDVRETLLQSILRPSRTNFSQPSSVGLNLFHPIPVNRTCKHAGIPKEYCSCQRHEHLVNLNETAVIRSLISSTVDFLNSLTKPKRKLCVKLQFEKLIEVKTLYDDENWLIPFKNDTDFAITLQTIPGSAILVVSGTYQKQKFEMSPNIKRLNAYGTSSECVKDDKLKLICFCKQ